MAFKRRCVPTKATWIFISVCVRARIQRAVGRLEVAGRKADKNLNLNLFVCLFVVFRFLTPWSQRSTGMLPQLGTQSPPDTLHKYLTEPCARHGPTACTERPNLSNTNPSSSDKSAGAGVVTLFLLAVPQSFTMYPWVQQGHSPWFPMRSDVWTVLLLELR